MAQDNLPIASATVASIRSLHSFQFKQSVMEQLYYTYGDGFNTLDILRSLNRWDKVSNETMTAEEQGFDHRTITLGSSVTVDNDNQLTFNLDADDVDSQQNFYPRVGFTVMFGDVINGFLQARISSISTAASPPTLVVNRYDQGSAVTFNSLDAASLVSTGQEVAIGDSAFATETGQPTATSLGTFEREFYAQIMKDTITFGGMELAKQKWVSPDGVHLWNEELSRGEFALDRQEEAALVFGQYNSGNITQASSVNNQNNLVYKNKGIWTWIEELGGDVNYDAVTDFQISDLDSAAEYLESQGVTNNIVLVLGGGSLMRRIENSGVEFVQGTSGGLNVNFTEVEGLAAANGGDPNMTLNIGFKAIKKGGILFLCRVLPMFNNPFMFGLSDYKLNDAAFMIPISKVKDKKSGLMIPNLSAKYVAIDGYSRRRNVASIAGMDGFVQQRYGYPTISEIDANNTYWLSHVMFPFMEANKSLLVKRSS